MGHAHQEMLELVQATREVFPKEWQPIIFAEHVYRKNSTEFTGYFVIEDLPVRLDWEFVDENEELTLQEILGRMKEFLLVDIAQGVLDDIRARNEALANK